MINTTIIDWSEDSSFLILMGREFLKNRPTARKVIW